LVVALLLPVLKRILVKQVQVLEIEVTETTDAEKEAK